MHELGIPETRVQHCMRPDEVDAVGSRVSMISDYLDVGDGQRRMDRISAAFVNRGPATSSSTSQPSHDNPASFITKIHSERRHVSTDMSLEYRIEADPAMLVRLAHSGIKGIRPEPSSGSKTMPDVDDSDDEGGGSRGRAKGPKAHPDPLSPLRMWCPAQMLWRVNPSIVREFEERKNGRKLGSSDRSSRTPETSNSAPRRSKKGKRKAPLSDLESDAEASDTPSSSGPGAVRDPVRRRLFIDDYPSSSQPQPFSVQSLVAKVHQSQTKAPAVAPRSFSSHDIAMIEHPEKMRPLDVAHRAAKMSRTSSMPLPSFHTQPPPNQQASVNGLSFRSLSQQSTSFRSDLGSDDYRTLFLYHIPDPCDPDLIRREDLQEQVPEMTFGWTEVASDPYGAGGHDSDDGNLVFEEKALDDILRCKFMEKAKETNVSYKLKPSRKAKVSISYSAPALGYTESPKRTQRCAASSPPSPTSSQLDECIQYDRWSSPGGEDIIELSSDDENLGSSTPTLTSSPRTLVSESTQSPISSSRSSTSRFSSVMLGSENVPLIDLS